MTDAVHQNRRVLIVDDNSAIHGDFVKVLGARSTPPEEIADLEMRLFGSEPQEAPRETFEVATALQGNVALEMVRDSLEADYPYAVAFVDMRMPPGWDGLETVSRIWEVDPHLQVVFCTAYSDYTRDEIARQLGITDRFLILKKPFDTVEVVQLASALCEKWRLAAESRMRLDELEATVANLEQSNQELERFGFIASHHLQEPLRIVSLYSGLLRKECAPLVGDRGMQYISQVTGAAARSRQLVLDLLAYSRLRNATPVDACVDLAALVREVVEELGETIKGAGARVEVGALPMVRGDESQWSLVFQQLIDNAIKFRGDDAPVVEIRSQRIGDGAWELEVADNGIGIEGCYSDTVLLLFQRLHTLERYPGTGAGLALCDAVVRLYGGKVWVETSAAGGASIRFTTPILDGAVGEKPEDEAPRT